MPIRFLTALLLMLALQRPASAQESSGDLPTSSPARIFALAAGLADAGRAEKDPLKLLAAANLAKAAGFVAAPRAPEGGAAEPPGYDAEALLGEAVTFGKGDASIAALADDIRARATKGRASNRGYSVAVAKGAAAEWYRGQRFKGGEPAEVVVTALSGAGFDLFVYDDRGNLVCRDLRQQHRGFCGWKPSTDGTFDIKIENRTSSALKYSLTTN